MVNYLLFLFTVVLSSFVLAALILSQLLAKGFVTEAPIIISLMYFLFLQLYLKEEISNGWKN